MPCPRPVVLERELLSLLRRAIAEERLDVADHLLRALEILAPSLVPGSALAQAYLTVSKAPPTHRREHGALSVEAETPHSSTGHVGPGARRATARRSRPR